jgi:hypothetical protein
MNNKNPIKSTDRFEIAILNALFQLLLITCLAGTVADQTKFDFNMYQNDLVSQLTSRPEVAAPGSVGHCRQRRVHPADMDRMTITPLNDIGRQTKNISPPANRILERFRLTASGIDR